MVCPMRSIGQTNNLECRAINSLIVRNDTHTNLQVVVEPLGIAQRKVYAPVATISLIARPAKG